jgi:peroxiredoxin
VQEFPNVLAAYRKYHDRGFEVLGISLDRERESLDKFIKEKSAPWTQVYDNEGKIAEKWGVQSIPATFLISPEGKIVRMNLRGPSLDRAVSQNLPKK